MRIVTDLQHYKARTSQRLILALGNFDGFHLGHQKLLQYVVSQAKKHQAQAAVLTFRQHPHSILHPKQKPLLLHSMEQKLFHLAQAGMDVCFLQSFTPAFSAISPEDFVKKILVKKLHILEICMGYDAHFGHARKGDTILMEKLARENKFFFKSMGPVRIGKKIVSSSWIRELLMKGDVEKVAQCLGRPFSIVGKIVHGKGHGAHLGFPTANIEPHSDILLPLGVYVASGRFLPNRKWFLSQGPLDKNLLLPPWMPGVMNFGKRPTYPKKETPKPVLELHLLDFEGKVYGEMMEIALHRFLRPEKRFAMEALLKTAIQKDVWTAQRYYKKSSILRELGN
ncbi:MAG TPA: riboflavin biosynthesis protein RibF [Candidatus Omnitrophota bacterium]|nr:riboflavin biosynthesis protein RibF [Candidatus Omnitrophota bacterium]